MFQWEHFLAVIVQAQMPVTVRQHKAEHHLESQQQGVKILVNGEIVQQLDMADGEISLTFHPVVPMFCIS